jgi:WD40 repeat protein
MADTGTDVSVFIAYWRPDREIVQELAQALETHQIRVKGDWQLSPGEPYAELLDSWIENASSFVFVLTPESLQSVECRRELDYAIRLGKRLAPVLHRPVKLEDIPPAVRGIHWSNLATSREIPATAELLAASFLKDLEWERRHNRLLARALDWQRRGQLRALELRGEDLQDSEKFLQEAVAKPELLPRPVKVQSDYVAASRKGESRFRRMVVASALAALLVALVLSTVAFRSEAGRRVEAERATRESKRAADKSAEAAKSLQLELEARKVADAKTAEAAMQAQIAAAQAKLAAAKSKEAADAAQRELDALTQAQNQKLETAKQQALAEANASRAETNAARARANSFLKASRDTLTSKPDLAAMLAVTAGRMLEKIGEGTEEPREALVDALGRLSGYGLGQPYEAPGNRDSTLDVTISPHGHWAVTIPPIFDRGVNAQPLLYDLEQPDTRPLPLGEKAWDFIWDRDDNWLLSAATSRVWDLRMLSRPPRTLANWQEQFPPLSSGLNLHQFGRYFVAVAKDNALGIWDIGSAGSTVTPELLNLPKDARAAFREDGNVVVVWSHDASGATVYHTAGGKFRTGAAVAGTLAAIDDVRFSPKGRWMLASGGGKSVIVDLAAANPASRTLPRAENQLGTTVFSPDETQLVSTPGVPGYDGSSVSYWKLDAATLKLVQLSNQPQTIPHFCADNRTVLLEHPYGYLATPNPPAVWRPASEPAIAGKILPADDAFVQSVLAPAAKPVFYVIYQGQNGMEMSRYECQKDLRFRGTSLLPEYPSTGKAIASEAFRWLYNRPFEQTAMPLWGLEPDRGLVNLRGHYRQIRHAVLSDDDSTIVTSATDGSVRYYRLNESDPAYHFPLPEPLVADPRRWPLETYQNRFEILRGDPLLVIDYDVGGQDDRSHPRYALTPKSQKIASFAMSGNRHWGTVVRTDGTVNLWSFSKDEFKRAGEWQSAIGAVGRILFDLSEQWALGVADSGAIALWPLPALPPASQPARHSVEVAQPGISASRFCAAPEGGALVVQDAEKHARLWTWTPRSAVKKVGAIETFGSEIQSCDLAPDARWLVIGLSGKSMIVRLDGATPEAKLLAGDPSGAILFDPQGRCFTIQAGTELRMWTTEAAWTGRPGLRLRTQEWTIGSIAADASGTWLSANDASAALLWHTGSTSPNIERMPAGIWPRWTAVGFTPDGGQLQLKNQERTATYPIQFRAAAALARRVVGRNPTPAEIARFFTGSPPLPALWEDR